MAGVAALAHQGTDPATSIILPPLHNHPAKLKLPVKGQRKIGAALNPKGCRLRDKKIPLAGHPEWICTLSIGIVTEKGAPHSETNGNLTVAWLLQREAAEAGSLRRFRNAPFGRACCATLNAWWERRAVLILPSH
ncbi:hypothetical protein PGTUg99_021604 [Puccinia graminis f. sp. tritici]|uniref:Uncharacterized protein n=1 Tax=Puccinia graminis f. sp. tritici TaxID=56615 RepID=A0A5B0N117_PUCGR|nr:hypothetical protein PGTUg99_021604 [Puccinia graminis f. sp. tritici]